MAENSLSYFLGQYNTVNAGSLALYYNYNTSGVYLNNVTGTSALNGGVFYQNFNQNLNNSSLWSNNTTTVLQNATIAPDGTNTAIKLIAQTNNGEHYLATANVGSGQFSCYVKSSNEYSRFFLRPISVINGSVLVDSASEFDISSGIIVSTGIGCSAAMTYINNGWYECSAIYTGGAAPLTEFRVEINRFGGPGNNISGIYFWGGQIESGITSNKFWQNSGSGYYSGTYSYTPTNGNFNLNSGTYVLIYNKTVANSATLISTIYTGVDNSSTTYYGGYEFGVTANNYLYFEYYSKNGPQVFTSNIPLADQSAVFLSLQTNKVSFGNYDYYANQLNSNSYAIESKYLFSPSGFYVGYNPGASGLYCHNKPFTGYIDEFLFFKNPVPASTLPTIFSGFVCDYYPATVTNVYTPTIGVTGTQSYVTGYFTKVTGYSAPYNGTGFDYFGNITYTGINVTPLTGTVSGTNVVQLTGIVNIFSGQIFTPESLTLNTNFRSTFGKKTINLIYPVSTGDVIDINLPSSSYPSNYENNLQLIYNAKNNVFSNQYLSNGLGYIVFQNGMALNSGSYNITGGVYNSGNQIINDYYVDTKNNIYLANNFNPRIDNISVAYADTFTGVYNSGLYIQNFTLPCPAVTSVTNLLPYSNNFLTPNFGNLVTYSNSFDQWTPYSNTIRNLQKNATDPFGGANNAWSFPISGCWNAPGTFHGAGLISPNQTSLGSILPNGIPLIISVWMKTDNPTGLTPYYTISINDSCGGKDLTSSLTTSWQRFYSYATYNTASNGQMQMVFIPKTGTPGPSVTGNIYLYGAQVEANSTVPGPYIENGATAITYNTASLPWVLSNVTLYPSQNLLYYSQQFDNSSYWAYGSVTVTPNAIIAPDGTLTADKFTNNGSDPSLGQAFAVSAGLTYTASVYMKADFPVSTLITIYDSTTASSQTTCNLTTSWQRFSVTRTIPTNATSAAVYINAGGQAAGTITYAWGVQLEANTTIPSAYIPTTSSVSTPSYNSQSDPFGGASAVKLIENSTNGSHYIKYDYISTPNQGTTNITPYTFSAYLKAAENRYVVLSINDEGGNSDYAIFDVLSGIAYNSSPYPYNSSNAFSNVNASIYSAGNGWYRCAMSVINTSNPYGLGAQVYLTNTNSSSVPQSYAGTGGGVYLYGAQLETGILPGAYLDNNTSSTRSCYVLPWDVNQNNIFYNGQKLITGTNTQMRGSVASIGPTNFAYITGENLLLYSQDFNSPSWSLNYTPSSGVLNAINNQADPFGSSTASLLQYTGTRNSSCFFSQKTPVNPSTIYTFSLYLTTGNLISKTLGYSFAVNDTGNIYIGDISNNIFIDGVVTGGGAGGIYQNPSYPGYPKFFPYTGTQSHTCTYVNNGWYRHQWVLNTSPSAAYISFSLWLSSYGVASVSGANVGIFGAQLELGSGATSYSRTANTINTTQTNGVYFLSGSQPFSSYSGQLFALPRNFQTEITGSAQTFYNLPQYYDNFSEVYKNGQRLAVEQDYLELALYDVNSGQGIFDSSANLLYNNNDLF